MKRLLYISSILFFVIAILFARPYNVLASGGDGGHELEAEVNGYHVTLTSQNEWAKGENTIVVTLTDSMGMPVRSADVEILIAPKSDGHAASEADPAQQQDTMPGMEDMGAPATESPAAPAHAEETTDPIAMMESNEHGMYMAEMHLETSGKHEIHIMFHINGEMLQADFVVEISGTGSKTIVLWSFVMVNVALVASAGMVKRKFITMKGGK